MKIVVNEKFAHLADFVRKIPLWDFPQERVFCNARNTVVKTSAGGVELVVKRYKERRAGHTNMPKNFSTEVYKQRGR